VILHAHGIRIKLPHGWSGRIFNRSQGATTLHTGNFTLAVHGEGEFGDHSTGAMRHGSSFLALTEYLPGEHLTPGAGLFASRRIPLPLDPTRFSEKGLAHPRAHQVGMQHFCTSHGRPFCLYVVIAGHRQHRRHQLHTVDHLLASLKISGR
jgi:hypothetical protein